MRVRMPGDSLKARLRSGVDGCFLFSLPLTEFFRFARSGEDDIIIADVSLLRPVVWTRLTGGVADSGDEDDSLSSSDPVKKKHHLFVRAF